MFREQGQESIEVAPKYYVVQFYSYDDFHGQVFKMTHQDFKTKEELTSFLERIKRNGEDIENIRVFYGHRAIPKFETIYNITFQSE